MLKVYYKSTIFILFFVFIFLFRFESSFLEKLSNYLSFLTLVIGTIVILNWLLLKGHLQLFPTIRNIFYFWFLMIGWFLIVPFLFFSTTSSLYEGMYSDYRFLLFSLLPFIFISNSGSYYYQKIYNNVGIVAILSGIFAIIVVDKSLTQVIDREYSWKLPYFLWWVVLCAYPYLLLKNYFLKKDSKGIVLLVIHLLLSLFFLKRTGFVGAFLLMFLSIWLSDNFSKKLKTFSVVGIIFLILIVFFGQYLDSLGFRFMSDIKDFESFDRKTEIDVFLDAVSMSQLFTGFGANNYLKMYYIGEQDNAVRALHVGFYNLIYKGGVPYVLFTLYLSYHILTLKKYVNDNPEIKIGFIIGIYFILSYSFENSWSYMPYHFFKLLPIYRAIYLKDQIILAKKAIDFRGLIYK